MQLARLVPLSLLATATLLSACAENDQVFLIVQNNAAGDEACLQSPSETNTGLSRGVADTKHGTYLFTPLMKSYANSNEGELIQQRTILIEGARVDITFSDPDLFTAAELETLATDGLTRYETRFTLPLTPDGGLATFGFEMLPRELLQLLDGKLAAGESTFVQTQTTVFGSMGGGDVDSTPFPYSIEICNGCLTENLGACPLPAGTTVKEPDTCGGGVVTCCDSGAGLTCPATVEADPV